MRKDSAMILLGASEWPEAKNFQANLSFARSAREVVSYFTREFGLAEDHLLDLFDSPAGPADQDRQIYEFLRDRKSDLENLLIYYIGHGGFTPNNDYYLSLRRTSSWNPGITSLRVLDLARTLRESASQIRRFLILDSCFSASATPPFMSSPLQAAAIKTEEAMPKRGTALLCSSGSRDPSKAPPNEKYTMFTGSLLAVLREGIPDASVPMLSLFQVGELVEERIFKEFADEAVRPEIHRPNQSKGDITRVPIFPNLATCSSTELARETRVWTPEESRAGIVNRGAAQPDPEGLFSRDPVRAFAAAEFLGKSSAPVEKAFLARLDFWSFVSEVAAEDLVTARPELGRTLAEIVTDRSFHFTTRITAANALRPIHKSIAEPLVSELYRSGLSGHFDDHRIAVEALGRLGEDHLFADSICDDEHGTPKNDYEFSKLNTYVLEALCRVFVNTAETFFGAPSLYQVARAWETIVRRVKNSGDHERRMVRILASGKPLHADAISEWLEGNSQDLQRVAIKVLGQMGIKRLGPKVLAFAQRAPAELKGDAYMAVSGIGTPSCVAFLEEQVRDSVKPADAEFPLLLTSHAIQDQARLTTILEILLDRDVFEKFDVWRIAGVKRLGGFETRIIEALGSSEPVERGIAALALSRIDPGKNAALIQETFGESSTNVEKVFTSLAVIKARILPLFSAAIDTLREALQEYSYGMRVQLKDDVVTVLTECGDRDGMHLGKCWARVYRKYPIRY